MIGDAIKDKLQNIVRGALLEEQGDYCTTVRNLLCKSFGSGPTIKSEFESRAILKEEQANFLISYARKTGLLLTTLPVGSQYLTKGGESLVYLNPEINTVFKVNSAVYYADWMEYFNSISIHNLLFPGTAYSLIGFTQIADSELSAIVSQKFISGDQADLNNIKELLTYNGFENIKRQDYYQNELNLLLEDMHDENVIAKDGVLFFIDTVFYIMKGEAPDKLS